MMQQAGLPQLRLEGMCNIDLIFEVLWKLLTTLNFNFKSLGHKLIQGSELSLFGNVKVLNERVFYFGSGDSDVVYIFK